MRFFLHFGLPLRRDFYQSMTTYANHCTAGTFTTPKLRDGRKAASRSLCVMLCWWSNLRRS